MQRGPELLARLVELHTFDPIALPGSRSSLYIPFEELLGTEFEATLRTNAREVQRTAVLGPIGCGKSSLVEFALQSIGETFAPIWISAAHEDERVVQQPSEFARHVIRMIIGWAEAVDAMGPEQREDFLLQTSRALPARSSIRQHSFGLKAALPWLAPQYTREITETLADPELERSQAAIVESLDRLVEVIHQDLKRVPVIIVDDSDRWLRIDHRVDRSALVEPFFRDTCRMLAERNWAVVVAIHPDYQEAPGYRDARREGYLNRLVEVPTLPDPETLGRLLDHRIRTSTDGASVGDILTDVAIEHLHEHYARSGSLRLALTIADQALSATIDAGRERIDEVDVDEVAVALFAL